MREIVIAARYAQVERRWRQPQRQHRGFGGLRQPGAAHQDRARGGRIDAHRHCHRPIGAVGRAGRGKGIERSLGQRADRNRAGKLGRGRRCHAIAGIGRSRADRAGIEARGKGQYRAGQRQHAHRAGQQHARGRACPRDDIGPFARDRGAVRQCCPHRHRSPCGHAENPPMSCAPLRANRAFARRAGGNRMAVLDAS